MMDDQEDLGYMAIEDKMVSEPTQQQHCLVSEPISQQQTMESIKDAHSLVREHDTMTVPTHDGDQGVFRLPDIEMHLWHITYYDKTTGGMKPDFVTTNCRLQNRKYSGTSLLFDPRTTEITRRILLEVLSTTTTEKAISTNTSFWHEMCRTFQSWKQYFHRKFMSVAMQRMHRLDTDTESPDDAAEEVFHLDTFIDHIQSYILRDYDIQRLDHQPNTKHIEWKNLYWMGYAYHLHVTISRGEHPMLDLIRPIATESS